MSFAPYSWTFDRWIGAIVSMGTLLYVKLGADLNSLLYVAIGVITCFRVAFLSSIITTTKVELVTGLNIYNFPPVSSATRLERAKSTH